MICEKDFGICDCPCHRAKTIGEAHDVFRMYHIFACCIVCPVCNERIRISATRWHEEECKKDGC